VSTKERYGNAVWDALMSLQNDLQEDAWGFHSVGEVMERAGVSRGTARKYLEMLNDKGHVRCVGNRKSGLFYQPVFGGME